jgi:hypothetical protein
MKKIQLYFFALVAGSLVSCNYLNVDDYFRDTFQEKDLFTSKTNVEKYLNGAVNEMPREGRLYAWTNYPGSTGSDEAVSMGTFFNGFINVDFPGTMLLTGRINYSNMGGWEWDLNVWPKCYKVIRKVNLILANIDNVPDMTTGEKADFRATARFLRAYAYYWILMQQGPMILLGDEVLDNNESPEYYDRQRNLYDECVDYICSELEAVAESLPLSQPVDMLGGPTTGAALALVARIRLHAASPLFNGGAAAQRYYGSFRRKSDNAHYISQTYDERKWALAAAAAKRVMDMGIYELHTVESNEFTVPLPTDVSDPNFATQPFPDGAVGIDPFRSYSDMFTGEAVDVINRELIWAERTIHGGDNLENQMDVVFPVEAGGSSVIAIPQRIIDQYYMADGRTINNSSREYPYENRMYDPSCVTGADKLYSKEYILKAGTYKAYDNREPRFYASIGFSGRFWPMGSTTETSKKNLTVEYWNGAAHGMNASNNGMYNLTGYTCTKYVHPRDARTGEGNRRINKTYPLIRYAEILLIYAEALNNLTTTHEVSGQSYSRDMMAIGKAFNQIRYRGGIPGVGAEELASADGFNALIRRERLIELLHENRRYYDICRWGIFEQLEREPLTGLNVRLSEWEGFYAPSVIPYSTIRERAFYPRYMLMPLHRDELRKMPNLDQNPGWEI